MKQLVFNIKSLFQFSIILSSLLGISNYGSGQTAGDYRCAVTGNWNVPATWETYNGISWIAAGAAPTSASGVISIQIGHVITVTSSVTVDQVIIDTGGQVTVNAGQTLTIANGAGTDMTVNGILDNSGAITTTGTLAFNNGSTYLHDQNGGVIPTATWSAASNCRITGETTTDPTGGGQNFGNLVYDSPGINFPVGTNPNTYDASFSIQGNLEIANTGVNILYLALPNSGTLTVGGNIIINDDFSLGGSNTNARTILVTGNFTQTAGILTRNTAGQSYITFNGSASHIFTYSGGTISDNINFTVNSGSTLQMGTGASPSIIPSTCLGTFTLSAGATLGVTSAAGITTTGSTGNIQVAGTRTYSAGANYTFNGTAAQVTGNGLTGANDLIINNNAGVTLSNAVNVTGTSTLTAGILITTGTNLLSINNTATTAISGGSVTAFINGPVRWTLPASLASGSTYNFPLGKGATYMPLSMVNPTTGIGAVTAQAEAFNINSGGTIDANLISKSTTEYWSLITTGNFTNSSVSLTTQAAIAPLNAIGGSTSLAGTYTSLAGTPGTYGVTGSNAIGTNRFFALAELAPTISTGAISGSPFCAGASVSVPFTITGTYTSGNVFTAQLSNSAGSFASPEDIGTLASTAAGTISGTIPAGTSAGTLYRIRVVSSTPAITGTANGINLTVNLIPAITAMTTTVCSGAGFTVTPVNGTNGVVPAGTTYSWPAPAVTGGLTGGALGSGASISGTLTNPSITAQTATYTVTPTSAGCVGSTFTVTVTVNPTPAITAMNSAICSGVAFTVTPVNVTNGIVPAGTTYTWPLPVVTGGITGGAIGTNAANISNTLTNPTNIVQTATYTVTPTSGSCAGSTFSIIITVNPKPAITPMTSIAFSEAGFTETPVNVTNGVVPAGTTYTWPGPVLTGDLTGGAASSGSPASITGTLANPGSTAQTATYTVTPTSGGCAGSTFTLTVTVNPITAYYSYQTGDWNTSTTWTSDPSGTLQIGATIPGNNDKVIILTGRTVFFPTDITSQNLNITIDAGGFLDLKSYKFTNSIYALQGQGTIKLASINFPVSVINTLINTGGGTTEYNNTANFTLPAAQTTYNNLTINSPGVVGTQLSNLTLNGNLYVKSGTFRINDNSSVTKLTLAINGNVTVENGAFITVGNGVTNTAIGGAGGTAPFLTYYLNFHTVIIKGDFINNGTVKFTNLPYPVYNAFPPIVAGATSGAASVYFQGSGDNSLNCDGITNFYNLIVDKGIDRTFKLTISSTSYSNFKVFGANELAIDGVVTSNPNLRKALWIRTGTLVLKGSLIIPSLSEGIAANSDYYIPFNGALEIDGVDVVVLSSADDYREINVAYSVTAPDNATIGVTRGGFSAMEIFGKLQINNGYLSTRESAGFITSNVSSGQFIINGGTIDAKQLCTSTGSASYNQTGGLFILRGRFQRTPSAYLTVADLTDISLATLNTSRATNGISTSCGSFNLEQPNNIFAMSGGTIRIYDVCGVAALEQKAFEVKSSSSNINVTGGTLEIRPTTGTVLTDAGNYFIITTAPLNNLLIDRAGSTSVVQLGLSPLVVLNDFTIASGDFSANIFNVTVGRDFFIASGTSYNSGTNTTTFNGTGVQTFTINLATPLTLNKLTIDKPAGTALNLAGTQSVLNVSDNFRLVLGTLNDNGKSVNVAKNIYNSGIHSGTGRIALNGTLPQTIDGNGVFGNIELNNTNGAAAPVSLLANMTINGVLTFSQDKLFDIGINNLKLNSSSLIANSSATRYIQTTGNAGDGGVTKVYSSNAAFTFHVGSPTSTPVRPVKYTPATIGFTSAPAAFGSVTVIPVGYEHPNTIINGQSLTYFWRVKSSGFSGIAANSVTHSFTYSQSDVVGTESNYIPSLFTSTDFTWKKGTNSNPPVDITNNLITDWTTPDNSTAFLDGDYTAGENAFGSPLTFFYSIANSAWNLNTTWSYTSGGPPVPAGALEGVNFPGPNDLVFIENNHTVNLTDDQRCASLQIQAGSVLDIYIWTGSVFSLVSSHPSGNNGLFRLTTTVGSPKVFSFPANSDFSDFNNNHGTTEFYDIDGAVGAEYILPPNVTSYGNLILTAKGGDNLILPNNSYTTIKGDLTCSGDNPNAWVTMSWLTGGAYSPVIEKTVHVTGNMFINNGTFLFLDDQQPQHLIVDGNVTIAPGAVFDVYSDYPVANGGAPRFNSFEIGGSFINNSNLNPSARFITGNNYVNLLFSGNTNASITSGAGAVPNTVFNNVTVNKGNSQVTTLTCDIAGSLITPADNWFTLQNGTFRFMRTNPGSDFNVSTTSSFNIPQTAGFYIDYGNSGNRNILFGNSNSDANDLLLDGKLTLKNGNVYIGPVASPANNNDIEYSGSGTSAIEIQGGNLVVNGQIRRNISTTNGILNFSLSGGNVIINGNAANAGYAKLEVLNAGSSFSMSGGNLTIIRGGGTTYGDLYLRPASSSVTGGTIVFTNVIPNTLQNYILDANIPLNNLTITGAPGAGLNAILGLIISQLELNGTFTLSNAQSIFNSNSINVSLKGNLANNGTYNYGINTTTFNGGIQTISGGSVTNFNTLNVLSANSLTVNTSFSVNHDLFIGSGTLILGTKKLTLSGNLINNGTYTDDNNLGGISLSGTSLQQISGSGSFGKLEINNGSGVKLNNDIILQNNLVLTQGIFNINSNLLTLSQNSSIIGTPGINRMIMSDGVISSPGTRKFFTAAPQSFTFPVGVAGKYTPSIFTITANAAVGYINVNPIDGHHPSVLDHFNVLDFYWEIESSGISGFTGNVLLQYLPGDVAGTESNYVAARLVPPNSIWSKAPPGPATDNVNETTHQITFLFSGSSNLNADYTAGNDNAFPTEVPIYETNNNGNWSDQTIWTPVGSSPPCPAGGPYGATVIINHIVTTDVNNIFAVNTTINNELRVVSPTIGHTLGNVDGNGKVYLENGNLPGGSYTSFIDCSGNATIEYGGTGNYTIIAAQFSNLPNMLFTGTGTRVLPNKDLTICKRLVIDGPVLDNSVNNSRLTILGTMERYNSGAFISGTGASPASTVSFSGTSVQILGGPTGDFTGANKLNNLEISNPAGLNIGVNGQIEVNNELLLTNGNITTTSSNKLTLVSTSPTAVIPAGGNATSFVNGPLIKQIINGGSFVYPIGQGITKGHAFTLTSSAGSTLAWTSEFFTPNPTAASLTAPLLVSNALEYWSVNTTIGATSKVKIGWDPMSALTPLMTLNGISDMRVAEFNIGSWNELTSVTTGDDYNGDVSTTDNVTISTIPKNYTIASVTPTIARASLSAGGPVCGTAGILVSFASFNPITLNYTLDYTFNGAAQPTINITSLPYTLPTPVPGEYKLTGFTYNNGANVGVVDGSIVNVYAAPPVSNAGPDQSLCGVSGAVLAGNDPAPYTGLWTIITGAGGTLINRNLNTTVFTGILGGTYTLRWTISNVTCTSSDEVVISFPVAAARPSNFTSAPAIVCQGSSGNVYTVPNVGGNTYNWTYSGTGHTINGTGNSVTVDFNATATSGVLSVTATNSCGTSAPRSVSLIVDTPAIATFSYAGTPYCPNAANPLPAFSGGGIAGTFSSTAGLVFVSTATGQVNLAASTSGTYSVTNTIAPSGGCGIITATSPITIISDLVWTGAVSTDWNVPGNWSCGFLPDLTTLVQIPDVPNKPVLSTGATGAVNNLLIDIGSSLTVSGNTIQIAGSITNNGTFNAAAGIVALNGSTAQLIGPSAFAGNTIKDLIINNPSGVTLQGALNITGIVTAQNGNLSTGGYLTLISTAAQTALIEGSGTGNITGNVTMQRYLSSGFGYKYFSSPFQSATVNEFGDDINLAASFPSVYRYDESRISSGWVSYINPLNILNPLQGYTVNFGAVNAPNTADISGVINNGNLSVTLYNHNNAYTKGFNLVGNPYPSPIDWNAGTGWTKTNIDNALYYFKASITDQYGGTYSTYINGTSSDGVVNNIIPSMQGFFIHVSDGTWPVTGTLATDNSVRITDLTHSFTKSKGSNNVSLIRLTAGFSDDINSSDPAVIYFDEKASSDFDSQLDALKLLNTDLSVANLYSVSPDGAKLSICALPLITDNFCKIPLGLKLNRAGNIIFRIRDIDETLTGMRIFLSDVIAGIDQDLLPDKEYSLYLGTGEQNNRFFLNLSSLTTDVKDNTSRKDLFSIYCTQGILKADINGLSGDEGTMKIYNLIGQVLFIKTFYETGYYEFNPGIKEGIYIVSYTTGKKISSKKIFIQNQ